MLAPFHISSVWGFQASQLTKRWWRDWAAPPALVRRQPVDLIARAVARCCAHRQELAVTAREGLAFVTELLAELLALRRLAAAQAAGAAHNPPPTPADRASAAALVWAKLVSRRQSLAAGPLRFAQRSLPIHRQFHFPRRPSGRVPILTPVYSLDWSGGCTPLWWQSVRGQSGRARSPPSSQTG